jgi:plastocyanin
LTTHPAARPTKRRARPRLAILPATAALALLAGCGSSSTNSSSSPATTASTPATTASTPATTSTPASTGSSSASSSLSVSAAPGGQLEYNTKSLTANAGKVSIAFTNMSPLGHNMTIESASGQIIGATPTFQGGTKTLSLDLKPGTYKFFCSVPGHRQAGMEGTLTVK